MSKEEILKLEKSLNEADSSKERDTRPILNELLSPNAKIVGPQGELFDKDFILKNHGPERTLFESVIVNELSIECFTETAIVHSLNTYKSESNSFTLRFFRVWMRQNNKWKVVGGSTTMVH